MFTNYNLDSIITDITADKHSHNANIISDHSRNQPAPPALHNTQTIESLGLGRGSLFEKW